MTWMSYFTDGDLLGKADKSRGKEIHLKNYSDEGFKVTRSAEVVMLEGY